MNISSILNQINNLNITPDESAGKVLPDINNLESGMKLLQSLNVGDTLLGEVIGKDGNSLLLNLGNNALLNAFCDADIDIDVGKTMAFSVKGNQNELSLIPMYVNMNPSLNTTNALKAASLPNTPAMQYVVSSMMEEGLPIDKESLYSMNRLVNTYPATDPKILSSMVRMNIPCTPEFVEQFTSYTNYEHAITDAFSDIFDSLPESIEQILNSENPSEASSTIKTLLEGLISLNESDTAVINPEDTVQIDSAKEFDKTNQSLNESVISEKTNIDEKQLSDIDSNAKAKNAVLPESIETKSGKDVENVKTFLAKTLSILDKPELENYEKNKSDIASLLKENDVSGSLKRLFTDKFLLRPEEVADKENISKLYEELNSKIKLLTDTISENVKTDTAILHEANNLNSNIEFMNHLNQAFNYVQIPLKMAGGEKTGELYVYKNKKSLAKDSDSVSALLHLDMDNLGPVDVHVMLNSGNKVQTKFFLKDDAALDLIAQNISILNERLEKRGYSNTCEFVNKDAKRAFDEIRSEGLYTVMSKDSIDVRA